MPLQTDDFSALLSESNVLFESCHDGKVHHPLGAAAYVFKTELMKPVLRYLGLIPAGVRFPPGSRSHETQVAVESLSLPARTEEEVATPEDIATLVIHIGAQPNNSPHVGTIVTFTLAFHLARRLQREYADLRARAISSTDASPTDWAQELRAVVQLDLVDTAPDSSKTTDIDGVTYQYSHRATGAMHAYLHDYHALLAELHAFVEGEVAYKVEFQEALMRTPAMCDALRAIIADRERLGPELAPETEVLALRCACPAPGCGAADKHGIRNTYSVEEGRTTVTFHCPHHGPHAVVLEDADARARVEMNTPLRNLARALAYMPDAVPLRRAHMRVTGADYAGFYQGQLFHRPLWFLRDTLEEGPLKAAMSWQPPVVMFAPLILDWSGAKLSKSLYVKEGAYEYLEQKYLLEYARMVREGKDRRVLFAMVDEWLREPKKAHSRHYSVEYIDLVYRLAAANTGGSQGSENLCD